MSTVINRVIPARAYLEELSRRMDEVCRLMKIAGETGPWKDEALSISDSMVVRAGQLRDALWDRRVNTLSLQELGEVLSGMALCEVVRTYDRELYELQNLIGQESHDQETASQKADVSGREALDCLERVHRALDVVMRQLAGAETHGASRQ